MGLFLGAVNEGVCSEIEMLVPASRTVRTVSQHILRGLAERGEVARPQPEPCIQSQDLRPEDPLRDRPERPQTQKRSGHVEYPSTTGWNETRTMVDRRISPVTR